MGGRSGEHGGGTGLLILKSPSVRSFKLRGFSCEVASVVSHLRNAIYGICKNDNTATCLLLKKSEKCLKKIM